MVLRSAPGASMMTALPSPVSPFKKKPDTSTSSFRPGGRRSGASLKTSLNSSKSICVIERRLMQVRVATASRRRAQRVPARAHLAVVILVH